MDSTERDNPERTLAIDRIVEMLSSSDFPLPRKEMYKHYRDLYGNLIEVDKVLLDLPGGIHRTTIGQIMEEYHLTRRLGRHPNTEMYYVKDDQITNWVSKYYGVRL